MKLPTIECPICGYALTVEAGAGAPSLDGLRVEVVLSLSDDAKEHLTDHAMEKQS